MLAEERKSSQKMKQRVEKVIGGKNFWIETGELAGRGREEKEKEKKRKERTGEKEEIEKGKKKKTKVPGSQLAWKTHLMLIN